MFTVLLIIDQTQLSHWLYREQGQGGMMWVVVRSYGTVPGVDCGPHNQYNRIIVEEVSIDC